MSPIGFRNVDIGSRFSPAGSYSFVTGYLNKNSIDPLEIPTDNDFSVFFDNNQIMARNWNVQYNSKALISVITTLTCLIPPQPSTLQMNPRLKPALWLKGIDNKESSDVEKDRMFRVKRNEYIPVVNSMEVIRKDIILENAGPLPKKNKM